MKPLFTSTISGTVPQRRTEAQYGRSSEGAAIWYRGGVPPVLNVTTAFGYHAAVLGLSFRDLDRSCAQSVTIENKPSRTGVVRRIA
jgi:hypothetical protein